MSMCASTAPSGRRSSMRHSRPTTRSSPRSRLRCSRRRLRDGGERPRSARREPALRLSSLPSVSVRRKRRLSGARLRRSVVPRRRPSMRLRRLSAARSRRSRGRRSVRLRSVLKRRELRLPALPSGQLLAVRTSGVVPMPPHPPSLLRALLLPPPLLPLVASTCPPRPARLLSLPSLLPPAVVPIDPPSAATLAAVEPSVPSVAVTVTVTAVTALGTVLGMARAVTREMVVPLVRAVMVLLLALGAGLAAPLVGTLVAHGGEAPVCEAAPSIHWWRSPDCCCRHAWCADATGRVGMLVVCL
eukprot:Colp12_sorted_trinity150504_noHs@27041